jgi:hypothetical protein
MEQQDLVARSAAGDREAFASLARVMWIVATPLQRTTF